MGPRILNLREVITPPPPPPRRGGQASCTDLNFELVKCKLLGPNQGDAKKQPEKSEALLETSGWFRF